jgi:ABC-2 type transport system ATP-binding protein
MNGRYISAGGAFRLPPGLLVGLLPLLAVIVALDAYCLTDLARARSVRGVPKVVWALIILFVSAPLGALVYLFVGRDRGGGRHVPPAPATVPQAAPPPLPPRAREEDGHAPGGPPPATGPAVVTTRGLTRDYGGTGLFDVDLEVPRGSVYGLVGLNGAGKTTLLSLLSGTRRPDRGTISMTIGRGRVAVCPDAPGSTAG